MPKKISVPKITRAIQTSRQSDSKKSSLEESFTKPSSIQTSLQKTAIKATYPKTQRVYLASLWRFCKESLEKTTINTAIE